MAVDAEIEAIRRLDCGDRRDVAVVDRFLKPTLGGAALEPDASPARDRLMRHVSVDIDTGHQAAAEAEAAGDRIVVDPVLRCFCCVEGFDPIGAERGGGHGASSLFDAQACTATTPPQSFRSPQPRRSSKGRAMDSHLPEYELYAIRYAERDARRSDHFIGGDPHDGPMPMDYFMWLARGGGRTFVIDTGFNTEIANKRKRTFLRCPVQTLGAFDIDAASVEDVILTHLHYDHAG